MMIRVRYIWYGVTVTVTVTDIVTYMHARTYLRGEGKVQPVASKTQRFHSPFHVRQTTLCLGQQLHGDAELTC